MTTTPHDRAIEAAYEAAPFSFKAEIERAIAAYLTSLAGDVEPMKLMPKTLPPMVLLQAGGVFISGGDDKETACDTVWRAYRAAWDAAPMGGEK